MHSTEELAALPVRNGFRLRGLDMTRIETFTDAAFAFALTLLVIAGDPPTTYDAMILAMRDVPAFIGSAVLLMVFWYGHNEWSRRYGLDDMRTVILSVALVVAVMVYVYPLRWVARGFFLFISAATGLPLSGSVGSGGTGAGEINGFFMIYGVGFAVIAAILALLYLHAWNQRTELQLNSTEERVTLGDVGAWGILCVVGVLSVLCAAADPFAGAPGFVYMLLPVVMPLYGWYLRKRLPPA